MASSVRCGCLRTRPVRSRAKCARAQRRSCRSILDHVKDAIMTVDETGRIETLNTTGERVFGYGEEDVRGKKLDLLIPSLARRPRIVETLEELAAIRREHPGRPHATRNQGPAPERQPVRRRDRREQGAARPPRSLRRLHARNHRRKAGRSGDPRERGPLPHAGRERARSHRRARHGRRPLRRVQRERRALLQDDARGTARDRPGKDQPARSSRTARRRSASPAATSIARSPATRRVSNGCTATRSGTTFPAKSAWCACPPRAGASIRGSIIDITERKRSELLAAGDRRVFERITAMPT